MEKKFVELAPGPEDFDVLPRRVRAVGREEQLSDVARKTALGENLRQIVDEVGAAQRANALDFFRAS
jgi:hypothetical protein